MATGYNAHRRVLLGIIIAAVASVFALVGFAKEANAALLPAPSVLTGPADGSTINTDSAQFVFQYLDPITGGSLAGFLCSVDGAPDVACDSGLDLVNLSAGAHTVGVKAVIDLVGGTPLCVLGICVDPGPVAVNTDLLSRTFSVDLGGSSVGTGGTDGTSGANGSNGVNGTAGSSNRSAAFLAAWVKYKNQRALCTRMKDHVHRYKTHKTRMSAAKRHKKCVKRQNQLRAAALALA